MSTMIVAEPMFSLHSAASPQRMRPASFQLQLNRIRYQDLVSHKQYPHDDCFVYPTKPIFQSHLNKSHSLDNRPLSTPVQPKDIQEPILKELVKELTETNLTTESTETNSTTESTKPNSITESTRTNFTTEPTETKLTTESNETKLTTEPTGLELQKKSKNTFSKKSLLKILKKVLLIPKKDPAAKTRKLIKHKNSNRFDEDDGILDDDDIRVGSIFVEGGIPSDLVNSNLRTAYVSSLRKLKLTSHRPLQQVLMINSIVDRLKTFVNKSIPEGSFDSSLNQRENPFTSYQARFPTPTSSNYRTSSPPHHHTLSLQKHRSLPTQRQVKSEGDLPTELKSKAHHRLSDPGTNQQSYLISYSSPFLKKKLQISNDSPPPSPMSATLHQSNEQ